MSLGKDLCQFLMERYALDVSVFSDSFLERIFSIRLTASGCRSEAEYIAGLDRCVEEFDNLKSQLYNSYSEFFRNSLTFSLLEQSILPKIIKDSAINLNNEIRLWSAGCASGQEPYSLAMLFDDFKTSHQIDFNYRIFATDCIEKELDCAKRAVFDIKTLKKTKLDFIEKYFRRNDSDFILDSRITNQVDFSYYDLLDKDSSAPPSSIFGDFDLIVCSNVLFYYESEYQQIILNKIHRSLKPGGIFITGEAETHLVNAFGGFRPFATPSAIFVKN